MSANGLLRKDQLELSLHDEKRLIEEGILKEDNPLDFSINFQRLCDACRRGDLKLCQEMIQEGANINAKDQYDYTPLILPLASHLTSLLSREHPKTHDITVVTPSESFRLHKFVLSARSPYFKSKLSQSPDTKLWKPAPTIPPQSFAIALKHLYLGEVPRDLGGGPGTGFTDSEILAGVDRISKHLEIHNLSQLILDSNDRRLARQRRQDEVQRGRDQLEQWFRENVLKHVIEVEISRADDVKWDRDNGIFADVLLRADEDEDEEEIAPERQPQQSQSATNALGIPIDQRSNTSRSPSRSRKPRKSKIYPCHKAMLIRSEYFTTMFESSFREAQDTPHLQIVPIDCSPEVLEIILTFLYAEKAEFGLDVAVDVLFAADMLFLEKVKAKAALVISSLGSGNAMAMPTAISPELATENGTSATPPEVEEDLDIYEILRAAWFTRVQRLEEFAARYIAYRLESYIDDPDFAELVKESASRISARQETDSIELLDDIRYYLSERFRLRFEDSGLEDVMDEEQAIMAETLAQSQSQSQGQAQVHSADESTTAAPVSLPQWGSQTTATPADSQKQGPQFPDDEGVDMSTPTPAPIADPDSVEALLQSGAVRTLDGELAGDEFAADAVNYQILLGKIDRLLEQLKLDA
ncbi:BTB/POZ domain containing protein [Fonsecaea pedrosoi]|nr:BTB/POZ domain containing protein [Fonsecaea pedrosoi]